MKLVFSMAVAATTAYAQQQTPFWKQPNDWEHIKPTWDACNGDQCDPKTAKYKAPKPWNPCPEGGDCNVPLCGPDGSGSCKSPPSRMNCPASRNNGCQKVELNWQVPDSCCGIEVYHLQIKGANGVWNDAPKIPGAMTSWSINSNTLRNAPYFLAINDRISFRIRGWSCNGWGGWSIDNEFDPVLPAKIQACSKYSVDECGENGRCEEVPFTERAQMSIQHKCCKSKSREVRESCGCGNAATRLYSGRPNASWDEESNTRTSVRNQWSSNGSVGNDCACQQKQSLNWKACSCLTIGAQNVVEDIPVWTGQQSVVGGASWDGSWQNGWSP